MSGQKEDSILKMDNRFGSVGIENQKLFIWIYTQINGLWSIPFYDSSGWCENIQTLPKIQISLLAIVKAGKSYI